VALSAALTDVFEGEKSGENGGFLRVLNPVAASTQAPPTEDCNALRLNGGGDLTLRVLDLACGSGEASLALYGWLRAMVPPQLGRLLLTAADPFTAGAFRARTGLPNVVSWSFEDVQAGCLQGRAFDMVMCSFAMHLLDDSRLFTTLHELSIAAKWLVLLSPHKRPHVKDGCGWQLVHSSVHERVHVRLYESNNASVLPN
jgi:hypothetical protein